PEDHLLPARHGRDARREVHLQGRRAQRGREPACPSGRGRRQGLRHRHPGLRGLPVITLGSLAFNGPFLAPLWTPPQSAGLYAVLVPGWRLLTFRALYFGQAELFDPQLLKAHSRHPEWLTIAGTYWNLYIA